MKVRDCMRQEVVTVKRSTTLGQLITTFQEHNFHLLPVVEQDNRLVGVVNFEDILKVFQPYSSELSNMLKTVPFLEIEAKEEDFLDADISEEMAMLIVVDDIMNTHFDSISPEEDINKARSVMKLHKVDHLCVAEEGRLVGMISLFDIAIAVFRERGVIQ